MSRAACPRSFEAEALRDDRLDAAERASFERHLSACGACARELQALELLAEPLRASSPAELDELHARRERIRLLAAYDRTQVAPERKPRRVWLALPALAVLIGGLLVWRFQPPELPARALVHADSTAVWSRATQADRELVVLQRGALFIRVEHPRPTRFVVVLPDGELEDIGTTFSVSAEPGRTTRVNVQEGSVVLRIKGLAPVVIGAGETWQPTAEACPPSVAPAPAPSAAKPPDPVRARRADPAAEFRAAMAELERGKPAEAAAGFARFGSRYPHDPRAEDAAYLRVIALQKLGAADAELKRAAQHYLARFPFGLRRVEVEKLLSAP